MKKTGLLLAFVSILLMLAATGSLLANLAEANPIYSPPISNAYIRNDGSIYPSTLPIQSSGNVYTFTSDVSNYTFTIQCSNIILDGAGFTLTGNGANWDQAITLQGQNNITVKNLIITQFAAGIDLSNSSNDIISNNNISASNCVNLDSSDGEQILGNSLSVGYGVYGSGSSEQIVGNTFTSGLSGPGQGVGIALTSSNTQISNNVFVDECSIQLLQSSQNTVISNNTLTNGIAGILIVRSSYNKVLGNIIEGKIFSQQPNEGGGGEGGLYLSDGCSNNIIYGNLFENDTYGISFGAQVVNLVWNNVYNNYIYGNSFVNNSQNAYVAPGSPANFWNENGEGNYWSDYQTTYPHASQADSSGIWNTPYVIDANNKDQYPLMNQVGISANLPTVTPSPTATPTATSSSIQSPTSTPFTPQPTDPTTAPTQTPTHTATPSPTSSPNPTVKPSINPTSTAAPTPLPSVPEFQTWVIPSIFLVSAVGVVAVALKKKPAGRGL